ncbi:Ig-like domain-containing protein [Paenibacillus caui]|uniref:Ig-like domain-containing protein n=1 Tax=Paenibacillus caui TaxID=2873927 RepID=UPI001CA813A5|nr:Ig-like domain-containing protein [Paenibacillus caui]
MKKWPILLVLVLMFNLFAGAGIGYTAGTSSVTLQSTLPVNGSKGVPVDTKVLKMTFSAEVKTGSGDIVIKDEQDNEYARITVSPVGSLNATQEITIPSSTNNMAPGTLYKVSVAAGVFVDSSGNDVPAFDWSFKTLTDGSTAPTATQEARVTDTSVELKLTFNQKVNQSASGHIYIKKASTNEAVATYAAKDVVLDSNNTVTLNVSNLARGERYYVLIDQGAFLNDDDLPYAGISSAQTWFFNIVGDEVALQSTAPASGGQNEAPTDKLLLNFSRPVYPDNGFISVRKEDGTETNRISVTSSDVSGGGTSKITVKLTSALIAGTAYTVTIHQGAFKDTDSNSYPKTADYSWNFKTGTAAPTQLSIDSLSPVDRSTNVGLNIVPTATFNRNIKSNGGAGSFANGTNGITLRKSGATAIPAAAISISGNRLTITPVQALDNGATYYVNIDNGAILDAATNAAFSGLSGASSWSFTTVVLDKTPPVLQNAQMYTNSVIRLQYDKALNASVNLLTSSFAVTVNGETRRLSNAYVSGDSVYITLETGVAVGQVVKISYYSSSLRPIEDNAHNATASLTNRDVTNGVVSVMPRPQSGYVSGNSVSLFFQDSLKSVSNYAYNQFSVTEDGVSVGIISIYQNGSAVTLFLSRAVSNGSAVKVSYVPGSYPLQDYRGQNISGFSDFYVRNYNDTKAPEFTGAGGSGNKVVLTYNEALSTSNVPLKSQYSVLVNNSPVFVTAVAIASNQVTLTLASSFTTSQNVTVSYVSGTGGLTDLNGNLAGYINLAPVNLVAAVDGVNSITVNGDTLTIQYNNTLVYNSSSLFTGLFYLKVNQQTRDIISATAGTDRVTLKLASPVTAGQSVVLSFMIGSSPSLYDQNGNAIKGFTNAPVQNLTPSGTSGSGSNTGTTLPANMTQLDSSLFGLSGYVLGVSSTHSSTLDRSRGGQTVNRNVIDSTKLKDSFSYIRSNATSNGRTLVFEVPLADKGAYVGVPIQPLYDAYSSDKTLSFGVRLGDALVVVPLNKIPFADITKTLGTGFSSGYLWIQMERVTKEKLNVSTSQGSVTSIPLVDPVDLNITVGAVIGAGTTPLRISGQTLYIRTANTVNPAQSSMTKYDNTAGKAYFFPTHIQTSGSYTILSGKLNEGGAVAGPSAGFASYADISNHWARAAITELANKLIVSDRSLNMFQPKLSITRAEFAEYISRGLGLTPDSGSAVRFSDVYIGSSASGYIGAAVKAGIVTGNTDGTFKPGSNITREQMALMMVRAMSAAGKDISLYSTSTQILSRFKDNKSIGDKQTVAKAVQAGIIQGTSTGTFNPKGTVTRAEAAIMLKRVLDNLNYLQ